MQSLFRTMGFAACLCLAAYSSSLLAEDAGQPAVSAFRAGDFERAAENYRDALAKDPQDAAAALGLGTIELYGNKLDAAEQHLRAAQNHGQDEARIARLMAQLAQRRGASGEYQFVPQTVSIPFVATDPLPVLKVRVNGTRDAYFLIDTGAGDVVVDKDFAQELGLHVQDSGVGMFAGGQRAQMQTASLESLSLGALTVRNIPVSVMPTRPFVLLPGKQMDGIIGTRLLYQFLATLDYVHGELVLRPKSSTADFEKSLDSASSQRMPMWLVGDHFIFARGHLNKGQDGLFNVDTGLAGGGVMATQATLEQAQVTLDTQHAVQGQGGGGTVSFVPFSAAVTLGGVMVSDVPGSYTPGGNPYGIFPFTVLGSVSHAFFRHYALTLDFENMQLILQRD